MSLPEKFSQTEIDRLTIQPSQEADVTKLEELDPSKIYHVTVSEESSTAESLKTMAEAFKSLGLRALFSRGSVQVEELAAMFSNLPDDKKKVLRDALKPKRKVEFADDFAQNGDLEKL